MKDLKMNKDIALILKRLKERQEKELNYAIECFAASQTEFGNKSKYMAKGIGIAIEEIEKIYSLSVISTNPFLDAFQNRNRRSVR